MNLTILNELPTGAASEVLESCCVSPSWIEHMLVARPFTSKKHALTIAQRIWDGLTEKDYLAAFEGHPQIGDVSTLRDKFSATAEKAENEQAGMSLANDTVIHEMMAANSEYLTKFGFIFIVCATGKSAEQMLALIKARINNERATELVISAEEQAKITNIRLEKIL